MKPLYFLIILWSSSGYSEIKDLCSRLDAVYQTKILKQIQTGISFDMIVLVHQNHRTTCKRILNYSYDLWKEKISLKVNGNLVGKFPVSEGQKITCEQLLCDEKKWDRNNNVVLQVLLNPIWEGETKNSFRTKTESGIHFYRLDWNDIIQDLPKDVEIINMETQL
jgi:hypothetical protein